MPITDAFNGSDGDLLTAHATSSGGSWTLEEGSASWQITSTNRARAQAVGRSTMAVTDAGISADQYAQALLQREDADGNWLAIAVRITGDTCYWANIQNSTGDVVVVRRLAASNSTLFGAASGVSVGVDVTLKLVVTGTSLEVFINGVSKGSVSDGNIASGQPGAHGFWGTAGTRASWDDFECTSPVAAGQPTERRWQQTPHHGQGGSLTGRGGGRIFGRVHSGLYVPSANRWDLRKAA